MEHYIKNVNDITYWPNLSPQFRFVKQSETKRRGLIRAYNLRRTFVLRKLCAH